MQAEFEDKPPEKPDWKEYLALARRRRWYFLVPLFLGWLIVWAVSWLLPVVYRSGTLILIERPTVSQEYVVPNVASNLQERLDSISQQILSRTRLLTIMDNFTLYPNEHTRVSPDEMVERMRKDIEIELVRSEQRDKLTAFNVYFSYGNPVIAQQVTRELTSVFISENLEARQQQSENTTKFLETQLEEARKGLSEQEQRLRKYKDLHLGELPGQLQSNLEILSGLHSQLQAEQDALSRAKQQNVYVESLLGQYRSLERSAGAGGNVSGGLPALDKELDRLRAELADLSSRYTDRHPDVRKLKEQIAKTERTKAQITADLQAKTSGSTSEGNSSPPEYGDIRQASPLMELQSQLKANQAETTNRQYAIKELQGKIADYQARLNQTPVREQQLADLTRDYDQSRTNYESLLAKKNQSELATNLEKRQQGGHFRILDPPSLPTKPYSPNRFKLSWIGLFVGLMLGAGSVAGAEFIDDRVYAGRELKKLLPVNMIVEIPPLPTLSEERTQRRRLWLGWVGTGLMFVSMIAGITLSYLHG